MKKILCFGDLHAPYHDRKALNLFVKVAKWWKPDVLVCLGDLADFFAISRFDKDPTKDRGLKHELVTVNHVLDELDSLASHKVFLHGNHEHRLKKYLMKNAPALSGLVTVEGCFNLQERGWESHQYQEPVTIGRVSFVHDLGYAGQNSLRQTINAYPANIIMGHSHRHESLTRGNLKHEKMTIANFGWLGDSKAIDYLPSVKVKADWTKGFGMIYLEKDGTPHIQSIKIDKGKAFVEGKVWQ